MDKVPFRHFPLSLLGISLLRITVAGLFLVNLGKRAVSFEIFFSEAGVFPANLARIHNITPRAFDPLSFFSSDATTAFFFGAGFVSGLLLLIGWRPRLMACLCFFIGTFIDARNQLLLNASYEMIRVLLFWLCFLPNDKRDRKGSVANIWTTCLTLQIAFFYFFGALLKTSKEWTLTGEAVGMAFRNQLLARTEMVQPFLEAPILLQGMTYFIWLIELLSPVILLCFFCRHNVRKVTLSILAMFHLSIFAVMDLGLIPFVNLAALLALWPYNGDEKSIPFKEPSPALGWLCLSILIFINSLGLAPHSAIAKLALPLAEIFLLDQKWEFFAPMPYEHDNEWTIVSATDGFASNARLALLPGAMETNDLSFEAKTFFLHLRKPTRQTYIAFFLEWTCRHQSAAEGSTLMLINSYYKTRLARHLQEQQQQLLGSTTCKRVRNSR